MNNSVMLTIDGQQRIVPAGTTIWQAARDVDIEIPALCHSDRMDPVGVCRMCVVDVGERVLAASCMRECQSGMTVDTNSEKVESHRRLLTELLLSEHASPCARETSTGDCELEALGRRYRKDEGGRMKDEEGASFHPSSFILHPSDRPSDSSSPVIAVDHSACILCDRCVRACDDVQSNEVIGRSGKGHAAQIAFDLNNPMGESTCVACGECVASCPTGALTQKMISLPVVPREELTAVDTVCPYCGVGCALTFYSQDNRIVMAEGRESPVNHSRLCVKGRYGWDYTMHPQRLTMPLIRRDDAYPKGPLSGEVKDSVSRRAGGIVDYDEVLPAFSEATWDEALDLIGEKLCGIRDEFGGNALAGFGSAKCSNEEAYLFQKLVRAGFGTNNVDHCTRLCHASSVAALMETIGSGAVTNVFADVARSSVALVTGSNAPANHPVAATFFKEAAKKGTDLIVVDVRRNELADFATHFAQIQPGSDVAFFNAVMHVLITEGLVDEPYIEQHTEDFHHVRDLVLKEFPPEEASRVCGVSAEEIRAIARTIGKATPPGGGGSMLVFWGMGISQHTHGTDNARCLISLCLMTGNVGKPGSGLHPLRGQNNVQGASDAGLIPMLFPDYQSVADAEIRQKFEAAWGRKLDPNPGLTVVEIMHGAIDRTIRGMYILGENPFISDPNSNKVRKALAALDFLVVQDIFLTETAEFADVILPASSYFEKTGTYTNTDRRVQVGRPVLESPGEARADWQVICEIAGRVGLPMSYASPAEVFDEFTSLTNNYKGLTHDNLGSTGKLWPCANPESEDGTQILFGDGFPTASGRGRFVPCLYQPADELPDEEYPFVLTTGRVLEHWHTGTMTRRSYALNSIAPDAFAAMNPDDLSRLGFPSDEMIAVSSRRGTIQLRVRSDDSIEPGCVFIPFHYREAAANVLTTDALDPYGKIPEFKFCAVRVDVPARV
jgi:formate dehydrogenase major subunit